MNNLIKSLFALSFLLCVVITTSLAQTRKTVIQTEKSKKEVLTNASVIRLVQLGLSEALIIEKIRQSECSFDLTVDGLAQLKSAKVSDTVIQIMMNPKAQTATSLPLSNNAVTSTPPSVNQWQEATAPPPNPAPAVASSGLTDRSGKPVPLPSDKGAYLWDGKKLTLLMQSQVPSMGTNVVRDIGGIFNPFMKKKLELQLLNRNAQVSFDDSQPIIIVSGLGDVIPGVPAYRLLYVKQGGIRKDRRILGTYDIGGFGSISMVDNEIACDIQKVSESVYAIKPKQPLKDGEYGLVQVQRLADVQADNKSFAAPPVWDFGIYAEGRLTR